MLSAVRWLILAASLSVGCHGARILAVFPALSRSHLISFQALTRELAARGHEVTVVSMFPQEKPLANYTDVAVPFTKFGMDDLNLFEIKDVNFLFMIKMFSQMGGKTCEYFLNDPGVQKLINAKDDSFDLLLIGLVFNECFLGFAHKFNIPFIGLAPMGGMHGMLDIVGNPSPYAYVPSPIKSFTDHMTFKQRFANTLTVTVEKWMRSLWMLPEQDSYMRKYFNASGPLPYVGDLERNMSMMLLNNHVTLNYPRPYLPSVVEVGGMHIKPGQKLPDDIQKYLDGAKDGAVYFSMGSNLKSSQLPEEKRQAFLDVFSKLKQRVLWKWEEESLPGQPGNVKLGKWLPQSPILEHPNVRVFITHGGLLSMQETVYHGVPMVGIPIFGDQELNMNRAEQLGYGLRLDFANITGDSLQWALNTVLNQPSYRESAKRLSARFRDQPHSPLERAVFWTEYVIRHGGAPQLRSAALDLAWYQYLLLDVLALGLLAAGLAGLVVYALAKAGIALATRGKLKHTKRKLN